jgi:hypothetical protein
VLSEALQRNAKHEARLSNISGSLRVPRTTDTILRFAQNDTVYGSDDSELHSPRFADHVLGPRRTTDDDLAHRNQTNASCDAQSSLSTSAVRHTEECQRVKGVLIRAADAEFDVPGEPGWSYTRIECCDRETSERREHIHAVDVREQHQRVVPERHVMATVDEDVEGELSRRLWIDYQIPSTGDSGPEIRIFFAVTVERAASERAMVGLSWRGRRRTHGGHEDGECGNDVSQDIFSVFHNTIFFSCLGCGLRSG